MGKLRFADIITYEELKKDLKKSNAICYVSGTGSGKSYWVENVLYKNGRVLFVTSRRTKLDQDLVHVDTTMSLFDIINRYTELHHLLTNHGLAQVVSKSTELRDDGMPANYLLDQYINLFDFIVIDEAHSIISDASFTDDSCLVQFFMEHAVELGKNVILLTATDKLLKNYLSNPIGKTKKWLYRDITQECLSTLPKIIFKITKEYAIKKIFGEHLGVHKIIYFANHTGTIREYYDLFTKGENTKKEKFFPKNEKLLKENQIAVLVSQEAKGNLGEDIVTPYSELAEAKLKADQVLPDDIMLLMATSRLKEGVSIKNEDMFMVVCESHNIMDMIQYMGRLRNASYAFYVISDSDPHWEKFDEIDYNYSSTDEIKAVNDFFKKLTSSSEKNRFIKMIENIRRYIRFDPIKQEFRPYSSRYEIEYFQHIMGEEIDDKEHKCVWEEDLEKFAFQNGIRINLDMLGCELDVETIFKELRAKYYSDGKPIELYDDTMEGAIEDIKRFFGITKKQVAAINRELEEKLSGKNIRIKFENAGYKKPKGVSTAKKKHMKCLCVEKIPRLNEKK